MANHDDWFMEYSKIQKVEEELQLLSAWVTGVIMERRKLRVGLSCALRGEFSPELVSPEQFMAVLSTIRGGVGGILALMAPVGK